MTTKAFVGLLIALAVLIVGGYAVLYATGVIGPSLYSPLGK